MSTHAPKYDVFVDLSSQSDEAVARDHLDQLLHDAGFAGTAGRVTLSAPDMSASRPNLLSASRDEMETGLDIDAVIDRSGIEALVRAVRTAARARRHLVVLLGTVVPDSAVFAELIEGFAQDPMLGMSQPRFAEPASDRIWPLPAADERAATTPMTFRASLLKLSADVMTPELPACCLVLRWELLIGVEHMDCGGKSLVGGLLHLLAEGRRLGFRNLVRNRVVVRTSLAYSEIYPPVAVAEIDPRNAGALLEFTRLSQRRAEILLDAGCPDARGRLRLLVDCRGLHAAHNGTAVCILGFLDGFARLDSRWDIHVLSTSVAAEYHQLAQRYPQFHLLIDTLDDTYAAAVVLHQPWSTESIAALHRHALVLGFLMLDVILLDIDPGQTGIEGTWQFAARHADALFYISYFTRERLNRRFPVAADVAEMVTHLSLAQEDHGDASQTLEPASNQILIFGNHYEHKHLLPTTQLLSDAFPFHQIVVMGLEEAPRHNVTVLTSGQTPRNEVDRLIASAGVIVFPSFYEGFGLPVVEGLARGRTVLVRRSALWTEIAAFSRLPGTLCAFDDPASLVEGVGRALAGLPMTELPRGTALGADEVPPDWGVCAQRMLDVLEDRLARPSMDHWRAREDVLRMTYG